MQNELPRGRIPLYVNGETRFIEYDTEEELARYLADLVKLHGDLYVTLKHPHDDDSNVEAFHIGSEPEAVEKTCQECQKKAKGKAR